MFRALRCALIGTFSMLAATSTYAGEAELSLEGRMGVDTNVLRRPTSPKSEARGDEQVEAAFWEFAPSVRAYERKEPLTYDVSYRAVRQQFIERRSLTGWDHIASGDATWRVTPVDTLSMSGAHRNVRRLRIGPDVDPADPTNFSARESDRQRIRFSNASAAYTHSFDPRRSLTLSFDFQDIDFVPNTNPSIDTVDTRAYTGSVSPSFVLDAKTSVGFGVTGRLRRNFGKRFVGTPAVQPRSDTEVLSGDFSLRIRRQLSSTASLSISAGPSIINTEIRAPQFAGPDLKDETNDVSWFAQASFQKRWRQSRVEITYSRFESASGGGGAASIVDQASFLFDHRPADRWTLRFILNWNQRVQLVDSSPIVFIPDQETSRYQAIASARYRIAKHVFVTSQVQYWHQQQLRENARNVSLDVFTGFIGLRYTFEPLAY